MQVIPGGDYAVLTHIGPYSGLGASYAQLFGQWLPRSGRRLRPTPSFEAYLNSPENTAPEDLIVDLHAPPEDPEKILSHNIYQRHVVLGGAGPARAGGAADDLICRIIRGGVEVARTTDPQANTGAWVGIVRHVADMLAAFGERLRAGEIIITGSVVPPLVIEQSESELAFALDPVGTVSVRFTH